MIYIIQLKHGYRVAFKTRDSLTLTCKAPPRLQFECGSDMFHWMQHNGSVLSADDVGQRREPRELLDTAMHNYSSWHVSAEGVFAEGTMEGTMVKLITRLSDGRLKVKSSGKLFVYDPLKHGNIIVTKPIIVR